MGEKDMGQRMYYEEYPIDDNMGSFIDEAVLEKNTSLPVLSPREV
jgi:hypothetical protein